MVLLLVHLLLFFPLLIFHDTHLYNKIIYLNLIWFLLYKFLELLLYLLIFNHLNEMTHFTPLLLLLLQTRLFLKSLHTYLYFFLLINFPFFLISKILYYQLFYSFLSQKPIIYDHQNDMKNTNYLLIQIFLIVSFFYFHSYLHNIEIN